MPVEVEKMAVEALVDFGGCAESRAKELVAAWQEVFAAEALSIVAGTERVTTSVSDQRVERVRSLVDQLDESPLPNPYELGVLLRVTETQARTVLRNWRARYPDHYEEKMKALAAKGGKGTGGTTADPTWVIQYRDFEVLEYAVNRLRRSGLQQGLKSDPGDLKLTVPKSTKAPDGSNAPKILRIP